MPKSAYMAPRPKAVPDPAQVLVSGLRLRDLQFLLSIAEHRSLSAAAVDISMTQPAASRWLRDIERLFSAHLFTRDRMTGMTPTPVGALVVERARALLADVSLLSSEIEAHRVGRGAHLRLGAIPYVSAQLLGQLVSTLLHDHAMTVSIVDGATEPLVESLRLQKLHAVIGRTHGQLLSGGLRQEVLYSEKACLLVQGDAAGRRQRRSPWSEVSSYRWIGPPKESPTWLAIVAACDAAGLVVPPLTLETASIKLVHALVASHPDMVAVLPLQAGADLEKLGGVQVVPFPFAFRMPPVGLIAHARQWQMSHVQALHTALHTLIASRPMLQ